MNLDDFVHFSVGFFIGGGVGTLVGLALYGLYKTFKKGDGNER